METCHYMKLIFLCMFLLFFLVVAEAGGPGTIYIGSSDLLEGELFIDNNGVPSYVSISRQSNQFCFCVMEWFWVGS